MNPSVWTTPAVPLNPGVSERNIKREEVKYF
jgi:hypothetical protein